MPQGDGSNHRFNALIKLVSVAGIELALQRPKRRVIPFHYTEICVYYTEKPYNAQV